MVSKVIIINYDMGNVGSVKNALDYLKVESVISDKQKDIINASHIILPGVGAFGEGMQRLKSKGILDLLENEVFQNKKPFLGICLGMQMLTDIGEERGKHNGLGWIKGKTRKIAVDEKNFRLPHIGWNDVLPKNNPRLFRWSEPNVFYFVHSYVVIPKDKNIITATCEYGETFATSIAQDNIFGVQFHPERSQKSGLNLLSNFLRLKN